MTARWMETRILIKIGVMNDDGNIVVMLRNEDITAAKTNHSKLCITSNVIYVRFIQTGVNSNTATLPKFPHVDNIQVQDLDPCSNNP